MLEANLVEEVIEVKRLDDRMMNIAMVCERNILHVFSVYVPLQGRPEDEKREFLVKLSHNIHDLPQEYLLLVAADMSCHTDSVLLSRAYGKYYINFDRLHHHV